MRALTNSRLVASGRGSGSPHHSRAWFNFCRCRFLSAEMTLLPSLCQLSVPFAVNLLLTASQHAFGVM